MSEKYRRRRILLLSSVLALGFTGCSTAVWTYSWHKERAPVIPANVQVFYSESTVSYSYLQIGKCKIKTRAYKDKRKFISTMNHSVKDAIREAAKQGASGLILSTPQAPSFPPICLAANATDDPLCERLNDIEAIAIAPK